MVSQTVHKAVTYYSPDEPRGRIIRNAPLDGNGEAWTLGAYEHPTYPSPLNVRVGKGGIKVWMVILWLRLCDDDVELVRQRYGNILSDEDITVAKWFYQRHKDWIDARLNEEAQIV